jgi:hypothetical protein
MHPSHVNRDDIMTRKLVFVLICQVAMSLVISACSSAESTRPASEPVTAPPEASRVEEAEPTREAGPPSDAVSQLIQRALRSDGSLSYDALVQRLGVPRRVQTRPISNQYVDGQVDTLRTLFYTGIKALVYDVTDSQKTFLVRFSISSTQYTTPEGIHVGTSEKQVLNTLGAPTRRNDSSGELIYQETESKPTAMVVQVRDGRVVAINWEFYFA